MRRQVLTVAMLLAPASAAGEPAARSIPQPDLVIVWAPGADVTPLAAVARSAGAALIDHSPPPAARAAAALAIEVRASLTRAIEAYDTLRLDDAWRALEIARELVDRSGADGLDRGRLSDLLLYRGLVQTQRQEDAAAWDDLVSAVVIDPARVLDPVRFAPRVIDTIARARASVLALPRARLDVEAPPACVIRLDGAVHDAAVPVLPGSHWVHARCPAHAGWGARVDVIAPATRIVAQVTPITPPALPDALTQARVAGARAMIFVEVAGAVATARLLGIDGREHRRRTLAVRGDLGPVAGAVSDLLAPEPTRPDRRAPWYRSRWAWAAAAASIVAVIAVPVTYALARDGGDPTLRVRGPEAVP